MRNGYPPETVKRIVLTQFDLAEILFERYVTQADTQVLTPLFFTHTESEQQA